jgi:hypothetical protein
MRLTHIQKGNAFTREKGIERTPISVVKVHEDRVLYQYHKGNRFHNGCVSRDLFDREYVRYHMPRPAAQPAQQFKKAA